MVNYLKYAPGNKNISEYNFNKFISLNTTKKGSQNRSNNNKTATKKM